MFQCCTSQPPLWFTFCKFDECNEMKIRWSIRWNRIMNGQIQREFVTGTQEIKWTVSGGVSVATPPVRVSFSREKERDRDRKKKFPAHFPWNNSPFYLKVTIRWVTSSALWFLVIVAIFATVKICSTWTSILWRWDKVKAAHDKEVKLKRRCVAPSTILSALSKIKFIRGECVCIGGVLCICVCACLCWRPKLGR